MEPDLSVRTGAVHRSAEEEEMVPVSSVPSDSVLSSVASVLSPPEPTLVPVAVSSKAWRTARPSLLELSTPSEAAPAAARRERLAVCDMEIPRAAPGEDDLESGMDSTARLEKGVAWSAAGSAVRERRPDFSEPRRDAPRLLLSCLR